MVLACQLGQTPAVPGCCGRWMAEGMGWAYGCVGAGHSTSCQPVQSTQRAVLGQDRELLPGCVVAEMVGEQLHWLAG